MNKQQKEVQQAFLDSEKAVLKKLESNYKDAIEEIDNRIAILQGRQDADLQHVIYQVEYQKALKTQVQTILEQLQNNNFESISEYLTKSYEDGFLGTMYDLQGQGIPLVFPIDQEQIVAAIQHETKLSESLYSALGKDTKLLSKQIAGEISRGISNAAMYSEMSRNIAGYCGISKNKAMRIARTEAHRIQCKATADAQWKAKEKGADIVKQWDSSLDGNTRPTHRQLDGQIRELDEPFEVAGMKAMEPGGFGIASEDINCRCGLLQRARWALGAEYTKWSPDAPVEISDEGSTQLLKVEAKNFTEFKGYYKDITGQMTMNLENSGSNRVRSSVPKIKDADLMFSEKANSKMTAKERFDAQMEVSKSYNGMPTKVRQSLSDSIFEFGHENSSCDIAHKKINVGIGAKKEDIDHEYGHLIEKYMMNKSDVDAYKASLTKGLSYANIKTSIYYDNIGNEHNVFVLSGGNFESEYQSRLYVRNIIDALNEDGTINTDVMLECVSEPFRKYMNGEHISSEAKKLIEGAIL